MITPNMILSLDQGPKWQPLPDTPDAEAEPAPQPRRVRFALLALFRTFRPA